MQTSDLCSAKTSSSLVEDLRGTRSIRSDLMECQQPPNRSSPQALAGPLIGLTVRAPNFPPITTHHPFPEGHPREGYARIASAPGPREWRQVLRCLYDKRRGAETRGASRPRSPQAIGPPSRFRIPARWCPRDPGPSPPDLELIGPLPVGMLASSWSQICVSRRGDCGGRERVCCVTAWPRSMASLLRGPSVIV
jgi:hypothetical protein